MATARHLMNAFQIQISPTGQISNAEGYLAVLDNTSIDWKNNATFDAKIVFANGNVIPAPHGQTTSSISDSAATVNYTVQDSFGTVRGGPYCIQWGNGVLAISVSANSPGFTVAVPGYAPGSTGNIQFTSDAKYQITWTDQAGNPAPNVWTPQPADVLLTPPVGQNPNPVQAAQPGANGPYTCTFSKAINVPTKGTVHVGS